MAWTPNSRSSLYFYVILSKSSFNRTASLSALPALFVRNFFSASEASSFVYNIFTEFVAACFSFRALICCKLIVSICFVSLSFSITKFELLDLTVAISASFRVIKFFASVTSFRSPIFYLFSAAKLSINLLFSVIFLCRSPSSALHFNSKALISP